MTADNGLVAIAIHSHSNTPHDSRSQSSRSSESRGRIDVFNWSTPGGPLTGSGGRVQ